MYSDLIVRHFGDPQFVGDLEKRNVEFEVGNTVCGDRVRVQAYFDGVTVSHIVFRAWGCATSVATADIFCEKALNKSLTELKSRTESDMATLLGTLEPSQQHCVHIMRELHQQLVKEMSKEELVHEV